MTIHRALLAALLALSAVSAPALADVFLLNAIQNEPPNTAAGVLRPTNGMTMAQVEARFGPPQKKDPAVGQPPITRWVYAKFTVYFEKNLVIHAVVHRNAVEKNK